LENVMVGRHTCYTHGLFQSVFKTPKERREEVDLRETAVRELEFVELEAKAGFEARNLSYGEQRRLEIARALASDPELILLDEPAAGMNPQETKDLDELIVRIKDTENISILLIEHDMKLVMNISERIYVMEYGKKIAHGSPQEIRSNPKVIEAYLGEGGDDA